MAAARTDESDEPNIDRLDSHARQLFCDLLRSERSPVAMVGSGLSIVYGGVSWQRSVELCLDFTAERIAQAIKRTTGIYSERLRRLSNAIEAFQASKALDAPSDKYVALDLCSDALNILDSLPRAVRGECLLTDDRPPDVSSFRAFMAKVYKDDTLFVRLTLNQRFLVAKKAIGAIEPADEIKLANSLRRAVLKLSDADLQRLASSIYSMTFFESLTRRSKELSEVFGEILNELKSDVLLNGWVSQPDILPIDRRSILNLFLADLPAADRRRLLRGQLNKLRRPAHVAKALGPQRPLLDPIRGLQHWLGVNRYITLNFDFQLEHSLILDDIRSAYPPPSGLESAILEGQLQGNGETGAFTRRFNDGLAGSTDIYSDKAVARLYEFALNSSDYRAQILHLHGRADLPGTMILTDTDNNRQYRRNRHSRTTLEQALDVTLTGNPVLFVGIGLSEAEITRALREVVSRGHSTPNNPAFAIIPIIHVGTSAWRQQMASYKQYGIHLIAAGLPSLSGGDGLADTLKVVDQLIERARSLEKTPKRARAANQRLATLAEDLTLISKQLWLDKFVFKEIAQQLCAAHALGGTPVFQAASWRDYLERIKDKLITLATVNCLRDLRDQSASFNTARRLSSPYGVHGTDPGVATATPAAGYLRIRDEELWKPLNRPVSSRHLGTLETPPPSQIVSIAGQIDDAKSEIVTCFAPLGAGKGTMVRCLAKLYEDRGHQALVLNCNFGVEFESVIIRIQRFLWYNSQLRSGDVDPPILDRMQSIDQALRNKAAYDRPTIIIAGLERLVDSRAQPVAPELDLLLAYLFTTEFTASGFQLVIVGADGCRPYIEALLNDSGLSQGNYCTDIPWDAPTDASTGFLGHLTRTALMKCDVQRRHSLARSIEAAMLFPVHANLPNSARSAAITAVLRIVLERWHEIAFPPEQITPANRLKGQLDLIVLRELAFVGMPIEARFLYHLTDIRDLSDLITAIRLNRPPDKLDLAARANGMAIEVASSIKRLQSFGLVVPIGSYREAGEERVVLHRSVMAEVRDRYGVRSGDEMLSNSFSLTLSISMPTDLVVADWDIHQRLKLTVGRLRGAWKDSDHSEEIELALAKIRAVMAGKDGHQFDAVALRFEETYSRLDRALHMATNPIDTSIRAAAGVIRGFFAAASLVALMPAGQERLDGQLGEFEEHKRRLGHIVGRFRESQSAGADVFRLVEELRPSAPAQLEEPLDRIIAAVAPAGGPVGLYGGEIVWLLNEGAVIASLQGDLYRAQRGFRDAQRANQTYRTPMHGQAWRRIEINRCFVLIERGRIGEARARLQEVAGEMRGPQRRSASEDRLTKPLVETYLALCEHLEGNYTGAEKLFTQSIRGLAETEQQRALAITYIRRASLRFGLNQSDAANEDIQLGLAAAESGRQLDIVWRARLAQLRGLDTNGDTKLAETIFREARQYAHLMELPRVAVQAVRGEAEFRLAMDDLEASSMLASEAMRIATRYGMTLQRIALRVLMGTILLRRGDRSGHYLLQRALAHADRVGYQLQVDRAQQAILKASEFRGL